MAYFAGWVFQKETKWADDVNDHILLCHQVRQALHPPLKHFFGQCPANC